MSFLRSQTGLTQAEFGKKARVAQSEVSAYELGRQAPPEEALRRMGEAAGFDWSLMVVLRECFRNVLLAASRRIQIPEEQPLDIAILKPALANAADAIRYLLSATG